jgi:flagellar protein FliS
MPAVHPLRQYQQQALSAASPTEIIDKLYGIGVAAAHRGDVQKTRRVLTELMASLDHERGGELAGRLYDLYDYALRETADGNVAAAADVLTSLRESWREGVLVRHAA